MAQNQVSCRKNSSRKRISRAKPKNVRAKIKNRRGLKALRKAHAAKIRMQQFGDRRSAREVVQRILGKGAAPFLALLKHLLTLGHFAAEVACIPDPRDQSRIEYSVFEIFIGALFMMFLHCGSRNKYNNMRASPHFEANLHASFGIRLPHGDTIDYFFREVDTVHLERLLVVFVKALIRAKALESVRLNGKFTLIIDGTGIGGLPENDMDSDWATWLISKLGKEFSKRAYVLALLVGPSGMRIPIAWEPIEIQDEHTKQDCELNAGKRLLEKIRRIFPRSSLIILADALYSGRPFLEEVIARGWKFIVTLKEGYTQLLYESAQNAIIGVLSASERKIDISSKFEASVATSFFTPERDSTELNGGTLSDDIHVPLGQNSGNVIYRQITWTSALPLAEDNTQALSILEANTPLMEALDREANDPSINLIHYMYITNIPITRASVLGIEKIARSRWMVEESFNHLKNRGPLIKHKYSRTSTNASKCYLCIALLAYAFEQTMAASKVFRKFFTDRFDKVTLNYVWTTIAGILQFQAIEGLFGLEDAKSLCLVRDH